MSGREDNVKMSSFSRKLEELLIIKSMQNFSAKMLPFFDSDNNPFLSEFYSSIMASDSPTGEFKDNFQYTVPGRSTPPPTTSYLPAKQESTAIEPAGNVTKVEKEDDLKEHKEKDKEKEKEKDDVDMSSPDANPGYKPTEAKQEKRDDFKEDKGGDVKMNGGKNLESQIMLPMEAKDPDEKEEDSCTVNCLYYTMQCCECTIT